MDTGYFLTFEHHSLVRRAFAIFSNFLQLAAMPWTSRPKSRHAATKPTAKLTSPEVRTNLPNAGIIALFNFGYQPIEALTLFAEYAVKDERGQAKAQREPADNEQND
jgi:hypothetical protein